MLDMGFIADMKFIMAKMPAKQFLGHYAQRLNCVEINYTFRRLPAATTPAADRASLRYVWLAALVIHGPAWTMPNAVNAKPPTRPRSRRSWGAPSSNACPASSCALRLCSSATTIIDAWSTCVAVVLKWTTM